MAYTPVYVILLCMTTIFCNFEGTDTTKLSHLEFTFALLSG